MMKIWLLFLSEACALGASSSVSCSATNSEECKGVSGRSVLQATSLDAEKLVLDGDAMVNLNTKEIGFSDILSMVMGCVDAIKNAAITFKASETDVAAGVSTFVEEIINALKPLIDDIPNMTPEKFEEAMKKDMENMEEDLKEAEADFKKFVKEGNEGYFLSGMGKILDRLEETVEYVLPSEVAKKVEAYLDAVSEILMGLGDTWDEFVTPNPPNQTVAALNLARVVNSAVASLLPEEIQNSRDFQIIDTSVDESLKMLSEQVLSWSFELAGKNVCTRKKVSNEDYKYPDDCNYNDQGKRRIGFDPAVEHGVNVCLPNDDHPKKIGWKLGGRKEEGMTAKALTGVKGARYPQCQKDGIYTNQVRTGKVLSKVTKCFADCPENDQTNAITKKNKYTNCFASCPDEFPIATKGFCGKTDEAYNNYISKRNAAILEMFAQAANYAAQIFTNEDNEEVIKGAVGAVGAISGAAAKIHASPC